MTEVTATEFRRNLFSLLDRADETGEPVFVRRRGRRYRLQPEPASEPVDQWARYEAWCEANGIQKQWSDADEADFQREWTEAKTDITANFWKRWDDFDKWEAELDRLEREGRGDEFEALLSRGY